MGHKALYLRVLNGLLSGLRERFPSPIQHCRGGRLKQLPIKDCAFLWSLWHCLLERQERLAAASSAISEAQRKSSCLSRVHKFWLTSTSPMQMSQMLCWTPLDLDVQAPELSPKAPLTEMGAQTLKFRCRCCCLELFWTLWSVISGWVLTAL